MRSEPGKRGLIVLMYHGLHRDKRDPGRFDPRYSVSPEAFASQMTRLAERASRVRTGSAVGRHGQPSECDAPEILVSFDDGDVSNASIASPTLLRHALTAVFFVTSDFVGRRGMLSPIQLRELAEAGMQIGSHGASHRFLNTLDAASLTGELVHSRELLEQIIGTPVRLLALPGGRGGTREVQAAQQAGYTTVYGSEPGANRHWDPSRLVQRIAITRSLSAQAFDQILAWQGPAIHRLRLRHSLLSMPKRMLGDDRYDRLRQAWVR